MELGNTMHDRSRLGAVAFEAAPCPIHVVDLHSGRLVAVNPAWVRYFGHPAATAIGCTRGELGLWRTTPTHTAEDSPDVAADRVGSPAGSQDNWRVVAANGEGRDVLRTSAECLLDGRRHEVVHLLDITERKRVEDSSRQRAMHDALTGLPNRLLLDDRLHTALATAAREGRQVAVLFIDFDHFKRINDTLGHAVGDILLREASHRLSQMVRRQDTLARIGGDEFVVLLNGLRASVDAGHVAGKILQALAPPFVLEGHRVTANASIGISLFPGDAADAQALLRNADSAMYAAKAQGRRTWQFFSAETNERALVRSRLESDLRRSALRSEFVSLYEPAWDLPSDALGGLRASLTWNRVGAHSVAPAEFMDVADQIGLGRLIDQWMINAAFGQIRTWADQSRFGVPVCLDLAARQFELAFVDTVRTALVRHAIEPRHVEFAIGESVLVTDLDRSRQIVSGLREQGCSVVVTDFGCGYSTGRYLRQLPLTGVRLGPEWLSSAREDLAGRVMLRASIEFARAIGLRVAVDGVSTSAELDLLRGLGVDAWSGALLAMPLPAAQIEARFDRTRTVVPFPARRAGDGFLSR